MKLSETKKQNTAAYKNILAGIFIIHSGLLYEAKAQNLMNGGLGPHPNLGNVLDNTIALNNSHPNLNNVSVNIARVTAPPIIDNSHPNIGNPPAIINNGPGRIVAANVIQKAQPKQVKKVVAATTKKPAPVYKPGITKPGPAAKPANKTVALNHNPKPTAPKKIKPKPTPTPVAVTFNNTFIEPQLPVSLSNISANQNMADNNSLVSNTFENITSNSPQQMDNNNSPVLKTVEKSVRMAAVASGSSKKSSRAISKSKHNTLTHFRYVTNKKIARLFAKNKRNKIDPARCFVWK